MPGSDGMNESQLLLYLGSSQTSGETDISEYSINVFASFTINDTVSASRSKDLSQLRRKDVGQ